MLFAIEITNIPPLTQSLFGSFFFFAEHKDHEEHHDGGEKEEPRISDEELIRLVDETLVEYDLDANGLINYAEFHKVRLLKSPATKQ